MLSVVIPVYRNEGSIPTLIEELSRIEQHVRRRFDRGTEVVFVVDGSPDNSHQLLKTLLPKASFQSQLLLHSRNFGSFPAIRSGLAAARGDYFAVIAADLQEPPSLLLDFLETMLARGSDIVVGVREKREDPFLTRLASALFWAGYRRWIVPQIPRGGVDVFGCNRRFRDELLSLQESHSSLIGLIYWIGFERAEVPYRRAQRIHGKSAWTFVKRLNYLFDSVFSFTALPIQLLTALGAFGTIIAIAVSALIMILRLGGYIEVPGYAPTILAISFFGALNLFGIGIVGSYAWRTYENTKRRPLAIVRHSIAFEGTPSNAEAGP